MDRKPFVPHPALRAVSPSDLPPDLAEFYARHEGVRRDSEWREDGGLVTEVYRTVRLCKLN